MLLQHLNRVIGNRRFPIDKEAVYDRTSTDRSGRSGRACKADERLHGSSDLLSITVVTFRTIDVLHDDIAAALVAKSLIDHGNPHGGIGAGVEDFANPVLDHVTSNNLQFWETPTTKSCEKIFTHMVNN